MSEEHWCQKCWLTKRTTYVNAYKQHLCDECFDYMVRMDLRQLKEKGLIY